MFRSRGLWLERFTGRRASCNKRKYTLNSLMVNRTDLATRKTKSCVFKAWKNEDVWWLDLMKIDEIQLLNHNNP